MFRCHDCNKTFSEPNFYEESHGLDAPPYERVAICPHCESTEFDEWEPNVEKSEVASTLVYAIAALNHLNNNIDDVFNSFKNDDLEKAQSLLLEFVEELYDDFIPSSISKDLLNATTQNDIDRIMLRLEG